MITRTKKIKVKKAKLICGGGLYRYIQLEELTAKLVLPTMRRIKLSDPEVEHSETWHFDLVFHLSRVTKQYVEYRLVDTIKVELPTPSKAKKK